MYQGSLNFIIYFYFPILKELIIYVSYCFISINNGLLLVKCYSHLVVSGFSKINLIHVPYLNSVVVLFVSILMLILMGISSLFYVYN